MFKDKKIACKDCGTEFIFSASEQEFYAQKGFTNEPARCPKCRSTRKTQIQNKKGAFGGRSQKKQMYTAVCSSCGKTASVPFQPTGDKPVFCSDCYKPSRNNKR